MRTWFLASLALLIGASVAQAQAVDSAAATLSDSTAESTPFLCYMPGTPGTADVIIPSIVIPGTPPTPDLWYACR